MQKSQSSQRDGMTYKTKVELALEMVKHQISIGTRFHYIGADCMVWQQLLVWAGIRQPAAIICA